MEEITNMIVVWGNVQAAGFDVLMHEDSGVIVCEQRPFMYGLSVAGQLKNKGLKVLYCSDNALGFLFYNKKIDKVYVFYEQKKDNKVICQSGTYYLCLLARQHNVDIIFSEGINIKDSKDLRGPDAGSIFSKSFVMAKNTDKYIIKPEREEILIEEFRS
ncbi:MAG: hypothetical protein WC214_03785 [Candidatus Omnitrophota bacterium]